MRRFKEDEGRGDARKLRQPVPLALVFRWQKAGKKEGIVGQAGADESRQRRRGARNRNDLVSRLDGLPGQPLAGIGDERCAGVGDQRH